MSNKKITVSLFGIVILVFLTYFAFQYIVFENDQPMVKYLNKIIEYAQNGRWAEAEDTSKKLDAIWQKEKYLLALNYAESDYFLFLDNLARLQGAIKTKNNTETVCQAMATLKLWNNFTKVIPAP